MHEQIIAPPREFLTRCQPEQTSHFTDATDKSICCSNTEQESLFQKNVIGPTQGNAALQWGVMSMEAICP